MDLQGDSLLAGPAFAVDQHAGIGVRRGQIDFFQKILHRLTFSDQFPVAVTLVVLDQLAFGLGPAVFRIGIGNMPDGVAVGFFILIIPVRIHCRLKQLMIRQDFSVGFFFLRYRLDIVIGQAVTETCGFGDIFAVHKNVECRPDPFRYGLGNIDSADPGDMDRFRLQFLQGFFEQFRIAGQPDAEDHDIFVIGGVIQEFRQSACAHAVNIGLFPMPQSQRRRTGITFPSPAGQNQIFHIYLQILNSQCSKYNLILFIMEIKRSYIFFFKFHLEKDRRTGLRIIQGVMMPELMVKN